MKFISSPHNATIRFAEQLQRKSKSRKKEGLFLIEGKREVLLAVKGGYQLSMLIICSDILYPDQTVEKSQVIADFELDSTTGVIEVHPEVYEKLAYRTGTEGCIAIAKSKRNALDELDLSKNSLILIAEAPEKPGNLGALLRTADAAQLDAVIIVDPVTDLYNPNVVRSSVGALFTVPIGIATAQECITFLKNEQIDLYAATLQASKRYDLMDYTTSTAIAVGTEATGLSADLRSAAKQNIIIPMNGHLDSMNVSVSAAIMLFEAKRQRNFTF